MCAHPPITRRIAAFLLALLFAPFAIAQVAGEVEFARGVGFAQTAGQPPRTLGRGTQLLEGDRLTTSEGGTAILRLADGTRMTLRPNSEMVLQQYQFRENAPDNGMLMQLVRGGFRTITGLISKGSPNAARIQTSTATIGIRGTDFDARLCTGGECAAESERIPESARPQQVAASAKVVSVSGGELAAVDARGERRVLVAGGSVYPGDVVETAAATQAVLAFRDDSRVTLGSRTRFRVDNFVYDPENAREGRFLASVLRGSVRALTGLIARANTRNVGFSTATATIGIRGTGVDMDCTGACAGEAPAGGSGLTLFTWLGAIEVTPQGQTALQVLQAGQGLYIPPSGPIVPLTAPPTFEGPRPDTVTPPPNLFTAAPVGESAQGLYVLVRDGHIELATATGVLHLGRGETGFAGLAGETARPQVVPRFMDFDRLPLPNARNPLLSTVLSESGITQRNQCR